MPWQQLIAIDSTKALIDLRYEIKTIPKHIYSMEKGN
jgi:hypothetical protein